MIIELILRVGEPPLVLNISQFVAYQDNGTPIAVGADYGPDATQAISMVGNPDFNRVLQILGVRKTVVVDKLHMPQPQPGARLIAGPR